MQAKNESARKKFIQQWESWCPPRDGRWLRQWRLAHNFSQAALAAALDVSVRTIIRWEQSEALPRVVVAALGGK